MNHKEAQKNARERRKKHHKERQQGKGKERKRTDGKEQEEGPTGQAHQETAKTRRKGKGLGSNGGEKQTKQKSQPIQRTEKRPRKSGPGKSPGRQRNKIRAGSRTKPLSKMP